MKHPEDLPGQDYPLIQPEIKNVKTEALHRSAFLCMVSRRPDHSKTILKTQKGHHSDQSLLTTII